MAIRDNLIEGVIDGLSKLTTVTESDKRKLVERYINMSDTETIKDLLQLVYRFVGENSPYYDYALELVTSINVSLCPPLEEIKTRLNNMFSNTVEGNMSLQENSKKVKETLTNVADIFNKFGIDYYVVGALPCFISKDIDLFRYHDDIDIMVNEGDLSKLGPLFDALGYDFHDDRFPSIERYRKAYGNGHIVYAQDRESEFHVGFFTFKREEDNTMTVTGYSNRLGEDRVITDVEQMHFDEIGTSLRYSDEAMIYNGVPIKMVTPEEVYILKGYTNRPKDITDMKKLEPFIDKEKIEMLKLHPYTSIKLEDVSSIENIKGVTL